MDLNLSKEDIEFLKQFGKELKDQENDCQASPRYWTVGDWVETRVPNGEGDTRFLLPEWDYATLEFDELKKELLGEYKDCFSESQISEIEELVDFGFYADDDLLEMAKKVDLDASIIGVEDKHIIRPNTMFLTKQEAKDHIAANHYHYTNKAHTYAMTAWRAQKVKRLFEILEKLGD